MPISVTCGCGKALRVKDEWAGRTVTCPGCGGTFVVGATGGKVAGAARGAEVWSGGRKSRGKTGKGGLGEKFSISTESDGGHAFAMALQRAYFLPCRHVPKHHLANRLNFNVAHHVSRVWWIL